MRFQLVMGLLFDNEQAKWLQLHEAVDEFNKCIEELTIQRNEYARKNRIREQQIDGLTNKFRELIKNMEDRDKILSDMVANLDSDGLLQ